MRHILLEWNKNKRATFGSTFDHSSRMSYPFTGCSSAEPVSVSLIIANVIIATDTVCFTLPKKYTLPL